MKLIRLYEVDNSPLVLYNSNAARAPSVDEQLLFLCCICISQPGKGPLDWAIALAAKSTDGNIAPNDSSLLDALRGAMTENRTTPGIAVIDCWMNISTVTKDHFHVPIFAYTLVRQ